MDYKLILWVGSGIPSFLAKTMDRYFRLETANDLDSISPKLAQYTPYCVIIEVSEPEAGMSSIVEQLCAAYQAIPIILITKTYTIELLLWSLRLKLCDCLTQPVSAEQILNSLSRFYKRDVSSLSFETQHHLSSISPENVESLTLNKKADLLRKAKAYIDKHLTEKIYARKVAGCCHMSLSQFSRWFRSEAGMTFQEYVLRKRIELAEQLLRNASASVIGICYSVGFNDPSYFSATFKRYMGTTPSIYRKTVINASRTAAFFSP